MTKILITGTNSFVGKNYLKYSKFEKIDEVSLFDKNPENLEFKNYDVVIHLVAIVHQTKRIPEQEYFKINKDLCLRVAEKAKKDKIKQFIFLSTVKVYGKFVPGSNPWNEVSVCKPDDSYGKSKFEAELALRNLEDKDFVVSIIRTPLVYGEGVRANMLSIMKLIDSSLLLPFKQIRNRRNFTSAENLVGFIDRVIERSASGIFIAMDERAISTTELVTMISANLGKKIILFRIPEFIIKTLMTFLPRIFERLYGSFEMDNTRTLSTLEFSPPVSIDEGIRKMVESFKSD